MFAGEARDLTAAARPGGRRARRSCCRPGDCAESFESFTADAIRDKLQGHPADGGRAHLFVGRARRSRSAASPASSPSPAPRPPRRSTASSCPSFRGHIVNDIAFTAAARAPHPERLLAAYHQSASTLNLLRAFTKGGFADLARVHAWNQEFVASSREGRRYEQLADEIDRAMRFMKACGVDTEPRAEAARGRLLHQPRGADPRLRGGADPAGLAHRRLVRLLGPPAVDRRAHPPARRRPRRVPARRRQPDRRARSARLPPPDEVAGPVRARSTRDGMPGRLTLVTRMGAGAGPRRACRRCSRRSREPGHPVVWACDPMHGNTFTAPTRAARPGDFDDDPGRDRRLLRRPPAEPAPGPAACTSSSPATTSPSASAAPRRSSTRDLDARYETMCDPRLNGRQSLDLAFQVAELLSG